MSNIDSPAVARRRVRLALRSAREEKQLTQTQIAQAMDWSLSKVMRIEKGEVNVSPGDLRVLLEHLDVRDPDKVRQLVDDARLSRQERWTIEAADREHLTPAMLELSQFESEAVTIRYYNYLVIPGILQTRDYAEAIFAKFRESLDHATIEERVAFRLRRRKQLLYGSRPPNVLVVLDESVLLRPLGGAHVMAKQLDALLTIVREAPVTIRILPFVATAASLAFYGPFTLLDLEENSTAALYREVSTGDQVSQATPDVVRHREVFEEMWSIALDTALSIERIAFAATQMRAAARLA